MIEIINNDIVLVDNFLINEHLNEVKNEINLLIENNQFVSYDEKEKTGMANTKYNRVYPYETHRDSKIIKIIENALFSPSFMNEIKKINSYPMTTLPRTDFNELQITSYDDGYKYQWHRDHFNYRLLSYVLPIEFINNSYTGGETRIIYDRKIIKDRKSVV